MSAILNELENLSSAEDFFAFFGLDFDPRVLAASRLHILKRFHDNLGREGELGALDPDAQRNVCRQCLCRAYDDFVSAPALTRKVFPRLAAIGNAFVPLSQIGSRTE